MTPYSKLPLVVKNDGRVFRKTDETWRTPGLLLEEQGSDTIVGLLSASIRLLNFAPDVYHEPAGISDAELEQVAHGLDQAAKGLDLLRICGSDTGAEHIALMLKQIAGWIRTRDRDAMRKEFDARYRPRKAPLLLRLRDRLEDRVRSLTRTMFRE